MKTILVIVVSLLLSLSAQASASVQASETLQETGVVVSVLDGDTIMFKDDSTQELQTVRLLGVNTPEVTGWQNKHFDKNYCGSVEATSFLKTILQNGTPIQLSSESKTSSNRGRIQRTVTVQNPATGQWDIDVSGLILQNGWGLWFTVEHETTRSLEYRKLFEQAYASKIGIWNPELCGPLEQPFADIALRVAWDAHGNDGGNVNGEYAIVLNNGPEVNLSGWTLRDSSVQYWYTFPEGTILPEKERIVVYVGSGTVTGVNFYMGSPVPIYPNLVANKFLGDGVYLLDKNDAYRFVRTYPCFNCTLDPLEGKVVIGKVNPKASPGGDRANKEYVQLVNKSSETVCLDGYFLRRKLSTFNFPADTCMASKGTITVRIGKGEAYGTNFKRTLFWGMSSTLLNDRYDKVELVSDQNTTISVKIIKSSIS